MSQEINRFSVNATWLIKLRWVAVAGQVITIAAVMFLFEIKIEMLWALWTVIILTAGSNLFLSLLFIRWLSSHEKRQLPNDRILGLVMLMDLISLTSLLFASGGPNNPFILFFFVNISLCALVLSHNWAWSLNVLSIICFTALLFEHHQIDELDLGIWMLPIRETGIISLPQLGMTIAFATCSTVIVYFMTRLTGELRMNQLDLARAELQRARSEKLEALGTLAAGAAHELATPLSTIAIVARDVEKALDEHPPTFDGAEEVIDDVHLIRSQLDRCRKILDRMASHAGQAAGHTFETVTISELVEEVLDEVPDKNRVVVELNESNSRETISIPLDDLCQALRALVQNAADADPKTIALEIIQDKRDWKIEIRDSGTGMSNETLNRVSEPFFTTKQPGKGMGLGLFLAENVVGRLGGDIKIVSALGQGTTVTVRLPKKPINRMAQFALKNDSMNPSSREDAE